MTMQLRPATRKSSNPLIGLYGESGCGKTYSGLMLARGMVGPSGKIAMIDTESGRGELYSDVIPGGYDVLPLGEPFSPARYVEAVKAVEAAGANICLIDSASHEWEGIGGVLDMAHDIEERTGKPGLHCWKQPKLDHAKFMLKMLSAGIPIIVCLRAHYKSRQVKDGGRTVIVKDDYTSPIQSEAFIYEMTAHAEILHDHSIRLTKCSHPDLRKCFPERGPITVQHGEAIARWCAAGAKDASGSPQAGSTPSSQPDAQAQDRKALVAELWLVCAGIHKVPKLGTKEAKAAGAKVLEQWLWDGGLLSPEGETLANVPSARLSEIIAAVKSKLSAEEGEGVRA